MTPYLSLAAFAAVMIFTPGVNNVLAARAGASSGMRAAVPLLAGLCLGVPVAVVVAVESLQAIAADPTVGSWLRGASTAYLIYLAVHIARAATPALDAPAPPRGSGWVRGMGISLTNPKTWAAALSTAAAFSSRIPDPHRLALAGGIAFLAGGAAALTTWFLFGHRLARLLHTPRRWRVFYCCLGGALLATVPAMWLA